MPRLIWKKSYNTGIEEIDNQHKQILDYLNQLYGAMKARDKKAIQDVIEGITDYTISHFSFEEALMEQASYPFVGPHKNVHKTLIKRVGQFKSRFLQGEDIMDEFYGVMKRWLINHIQRDDVAYVKSVNAYLQSTRPETSTEKNTTKSGWMSRTIKKFFNH